MMEGKAAREREKKKKVTHQYSQPRTRRHEAPQLKRLANGNVFHRFLVDYDYLR